jgi:hypothetical protein
MTFLQYSKRADKDLRAHDPAMAAVHRIKKPFIYAAAKVP